MICFFTIIFQLSLCFHVIFTLNDKDNIKIYNKNFILSYANFTKRTFFVESKNRG